MCMHTYIKIIVCAALFTGAACLFSSSVWAGSCCGGGGGAALVLPSFYESMVDVSVDVEHYNGLWESSGRYVSQPGYHLWQYRLNLG
jgi:hypothetical protein